MSKVQRPAMLAALRNARDRDASISETATPSSTGDFDVYFSEYDSANGAANKSDRFETDLHGNVNVLLGGAMLGGVITVVILICCCCHKNIRKQRPREYSRYSRAEPDVSGLEIFSMDAHTVRGYYEAAFTENREDNTTREPTAWTLSPPTPPTTRTSLWSSLSLPVPLSIPLPSSSSSPPPTYESLMFGKRDRSCRSLTDVKEDSPKRITGTPVAEQLSKSYVDIEMSSDLPKDDTRRDSSGLPSYEAALKLEADGYV